MRTTNDNAWKQAEGTRENDWKDEKYIEGMPWRTIQSFCCQQRNGGLSVAPLSEEDKIRLWGES